MSNITRIAWRNLWQHKTRTLVAGTVLFFGAVLLLAGQTLSGAVGSSLEKMITRSLTGDIVLLSTRNEGQINLFDFKNRETITNSDAVIRAVRSCPEIAGAAKMGKGIALIEQGGNRNAIPSFALGVDTRQYPVIFTQFRLLSGIPPSPGTKGIWLNETYARLFLRGKYKPGDTIPVTAPTRNGFMNMTKLKLRGIFRLEGIEGLASFINIMDIATYRTTYGMSVNAGILSARAKKAIKNNKDLLEGNFDPDRMLDTTVQDSALFNKNNGRQTIKAPTASEKALALQKSAALSEYIALKLKNGADRSSTIKKLNRIFRKRKLGVLAHSWKETAGPMEKWFSCSASSSFPWPLSYLPC